MTVGRRNSQIDSGFAHRTVSAIRARLAFVSETTIPILSISGIRRYCAVPSASEIAVLTLRTPMRFSTRATSRTATQTSGPKVPIGRDHGVDDRDRHDRRQAELGEVERQLDRTLAAVEEEGQRGADEAGGDERGRRDEEEPGDHRQLAHRERVRAATDVQVDDLRLGEIEAGGEQPDREDDRDGHRQVRRDELDREDERQGSEQQREQPDPRRAGRSVHELLDL